MLGACSDSSTPPRQLKPAAPSAAVASCRSGYHIATRDDGTLDCVPNTATVAPTLAPPPLLRRTRPGRYFGRLSNPTFAEDPT